MTTPDHTAQRDKTHGQVLELGGVYLDFSAGRRGVNDIECRWCGRHIHQHPQPGGVAANVKWYDGTGSFENDRTGDGPFGEIHQHEPALEMGPIMGPFEFVQITYQTLRDVEGDLIAFVNKDGDWEIVAPYLGAGECYSDFSLYTADYERSIR